MRVASLQMVSSTQLSHNLERAEHQLEQAAQAGAELALLPEYFAFMGQHDRDKLALAEAFGNGPVQDFLSHTARRLGMGVVGGSLALATEDPEHATNSSLVFDRHGQCISRYDKVHLFRYDNGQERYNEAAVLVAGERTVAFDWQSNAGQHWRIGQSICYDMRFPELYAQLQADVLLVPAAFTYTTGQAHWEVLLRARAIENQAYLLASAQGGWHENGRRTWGNSMVIGPWGEVLAQQAEGAGLVLADLDWAHLLRVRQQLPALQHRRL